jgi:hypothetical protein
MKTTLLLAMTATYNAGTISSQAVLVHASGNVVETTIPAVTDTSLAYISVAHVSNGDTNDAARWVSVNGYGTDYFAGGGPTPSFELDLGSVKSYDALAFWRYGGNGAEINSATLIEVKFSESPGDYTGSTAFTFRPVIDHALQQDFSFGEVVTGRYVQLRLLDNTQGERIGMSGIQFNTVPEPTTGALLGLMGISLILRRRKVK